MIRYDQPQKYLAGRQNMPTEKSSRELAEVPPKIRAHVFFSARVAEARVLDRMRSISDDYSAGRIDFATARWKMREFLASAEGGGHDPTKRGVASLASTARIDLILRQNAAMAAAVGQYEQEMDEDAMDLWPNWRYVHGKSRKPKTARMDHKSWDGKVFKKTDPIWRKIFPPNGFGCSCGVEQCDDDEAARYGGVIDGSNLPVDLGRDGFEFDPAHAFEGVPLEELALSPGGSAYLRSALLDAEQDQARDLDLGKLIDRVLGREPAAPEPPNFDAKMVEEAVKTTRRILPQTQVDLRKVRDAESVNRLNRTLAALAASYRLPALHRLETVDLIGAAGRTYESGRIEISTQLLNNVRNFAAKNRHENGRYLDSLAFLPVGREVEAVVTHEVGHLISFKAITVSRAVRSPGRQIIPKICVNRRSYVLSNLRAQPAQQRNHAAVRVGAGRVNPLRAAGQA